MVEIVQIIWVLSLVVLLVIAACVQLYDQKHRDAPKKPISQTDALGAQEAALREAASQSFRLNLMAIDAARKMSEAAARHSKNGSWN